MIQSYGKVTVAASGSPVQASSNGANIGDQTYTQCNAVLIEAWPTNTGKIYIGNTESMDASTGDGVVGILAKPSSGFIPSFSATVSYAPGGIDVAQFWVDAENSGDSVVISAVST